jgi:hypothetical protein
MTFRRAEGFALLLGVVSASGCAGVDSESASVETDGNEEALTRASGCRMFS